VGRAIELRKGGRSGCRLDSEMRKAIDYRLRPGIASQTNGLAIVRMMACTFDALDVSPGTRTFPNC